VLGGIWKKTVDKKHRITRLRPTRTHLTVIYWVVILCGLYVASLYSYLLFHSLAEVFSIVVACGIFMVAWNARSFMGMDCFVFLGIAYLFVGGLDFVHTMAYTGMGVFPGHATNLPTQLWIAARYLESGSLLIAPLIIGRRLRPDITFLGYALVTAVLLGSIFYWEIFPVCFIEGVGLTPFKKVSEYIISIVLFASMGILFSKRNEFDRGVLRLLMASIGVTIGSELAFTFYVHAYGFSNLVGHYLKIVSFYLIYKAVIEMGLIRPYSLMFRNLSLSEEALKKANETLEERVEERTAELAMANEQLKRGIRERKQVEKALRKSEHQLRHLSSQLLEAHEKERKLVAQELHDSIGSTLTVISMSLGRKIDQIGEGRSPLGVSLEDLVNMVQNAIEETRRIQMDLRPPLIDDLGILATINWFCREYEKAYPDIRIERLISIREKEVPEHLKIVVFRIIQEALNNIAKHSRATAARVSLKSTDHRIELVVRDNGKGFDPNGRSYKDNTGQGLGLDSMRERAQLSGGTFSLKSGRGKGTTVRAVWPSQDSDLRQS
jgi:signal transduction histidine kinase